mgnify:CR=1 FL=1
MAVMILPRTVALKRLGGRWSSVTSFTLPDKVGAGKEIPFEVEGHLDLKPPADWRNFAVGFFYVDGPMSEVTLRMNGQVYNLRPGYGAVKYITPFEPCSTIPLDCSIKSLDQGEYRFAAMTGYVKEDTLYYDDRVDRHVRAEAPAFPELPWWALPLAAGIGVVAIVGGVIAYEEHRRQELLLMMARR